MTSHIRGRSGSDGGPDFRPPRSPIDERHGRRTRTALVILAVLVLAAAGLAVYQFALRPSAHNSSLKLCPGSTPQFEVFKNNGACVGVTDGSYVFSPGLGPIEHAIAAENAKVV